MFSSGEQANTSNNAAAISDAISSISTTNTGVQTSPGAPPAIPLQGNADPAQIAGKAAEAASTAAQAASEAKAAVLASPGAELVQPLATQETFSLGEMDLPGVQNQGAVPEVEKFLAVNVGADVIGQFDVENSSQFQANLAAANSEIAKAAEQRDADRDAEINAADELAKEAVSNAQGEQDALVVEQRNAISDKRDETMQAQEAALADVRGQIDAEHAKQVAAIDTRIAADQARIDSEFSKAQAKAEKEVAAGDRKAAAEKAKAEREAENDSWWDAAVSFVSSAIDALASAVTAIFDAVRSAVNAIIEGVKALAAGIIDAAVSFVNGVIAAFGELAKNLIRDLLGKAFPELADALCSFVDEAVAYAQEKMTQLGEAVKETINGLLDTLGSVLNTILDVWEGAINLGLTLAKCVITGDWKGALIALLEAAVAVAGIGKEEFYSLIGNAETTIDIIVNDPGAFIGNLIDAVGQGFGQFADNFGDHVQNGLVEWLTGQASDTGIEMPESFDVAGIFDISLQVLGLTSEKLHEKAVEHLGEENVERIEFVWGFISSAIDGGMEGLWEHAKEYMDGLWDQVIGGITEFLTEKIVMAAVTKIASMFNPVGALVQAVITAWNVYQFLQERVQQIWGVVTSVVQSISDIATGNLGGAANMVEGALADLVPVAIDLLARILGLGGIGAKVKEVIQGVQEMVDNAIDSVIEKVKGFFTGGDKKKDGPVDSEAAVEPGPATAAPEAAPETAPTGPEGAPGVDAPANAPTVDAPGTGKPQAGDLQGAIFATRAGSIPVNFVSVAGGEAARLEASGRFSGHVGSQTLPKMTAEAEKLEGPGKQEALTALRAARMPAMSADSAATNYVRGEHTDKSRVDQAVRALAEPLLDAGNAIGAQIGNETKEDSVKNHEELADRAIARMRAPLPEGDFNTQRSAFQTRAAQVEAEINGQLESGVRTRIVLEANTERDAADGDLDFEVVISPNDTKKRSAAELTPSATEKISSQSDVTFVSLEDSMKTSKYAEFERRFMALAKRTGLESSQAEAQRVWAIVYNTLKSSKSTEAFAAVKRGVYTEHDDASKIGTTSSRADMSDATMKQLLSELKPITDALAPYMERYAKSGGRNNGIWAFWSGKPSMTVAKAHSHAMLEKSALGGMFDGINVRGDWNVELWGALSKAFAETAAQNHSQRTYRGFVGSWSTEEFSVFNGIEKEAFFRVAGATATAPAPEITWYAVAGKPGADGKLGDTGAHVAWDQAGGGLTGTLGSGERGAMTRMATDWNAAQIKKAEAAALAAAPKPVT